MKVFLLLLILLSACAYRETCPKDYPELAVSIPEEFKLYGYIGSVYGKRPFLLIKRGQEYALKVGGAGEVYLSSEEVCYGDECFKLPLPVEHLIFGRLLEGDERVVCRDGFRVFTKKSGNMRKEVVYRENLPVSLTLKGNYEIKAFLSSYDEKGFFKRVLLKINDQKLELFIEELEIPQG